MSTLLEKISKYFNLNHTEELLRGNPQLKDTLIRLHTVHFREYLLSVNTIVPKPTTYQVTIRNGRTYFLKWTGEGYEANILGRTYYLKHVDQFQSAVFKLERLFKMSPIDISDPESPDGDGVAGSDDANIDVDNDIRGEYHDYAEKNSGDAGFGTDFYGKGEEPQQPNPTGETQQEEATPPPEVKDFSKEKIEIV